MKRLPLGIQTFEKIINGDYLYADKTAYIREMTERYTYVFLSRPRRFGKSLLLSTISEYFSGNKKLFTGLDSSPEENSFPIIRLDFSQLDYNTPEELNASLIFLLSKDHSFDYAPSAPLNLKSTFITLVESLYASTGKKVIILIDEYDKPVTDLIDKPDAAEANREILRAFFGVIKSLDNKIRFMFITGVSKFSKLSLFSGLNQITDITLHPDFSCVCGVDQNELDRYFGDYIDRLSLHLKMTPEQVRNKIRFWYNGYSWDGREKVYNPYSLMNLFDFGQFQNYWFNTGTPAFLVKLIMKESTDFTLMENLPAVSQTFNSDDLKNINIRGLLFQTGYLTIKKIVSDGGETTYILGLPNYEVRDSLYKNLFAFMTNTAIEEVSHKSDDLKRSLSDGDIEAFSKITNSLLSAVPYSLHIPQEKYYHSLFIMLMFFSGIRINNEVMTATGRIDCVAETSDTVYIFEFKHNKTSKDALAQIKEKQYYRQYRISGKKTIIVGMNFSRDGVEYELEEI